METKSRVVLICPTLSVIDAAPVIREARDSAGVDCGVIIMSDYEPRGAVHVGNLMLDTALAWGAEWVVYINDDTHSYPANWLATLLRYAEAFPEVAVVVPGCGCRGGPQAAVKPGDTGYEFMTQPSAWVVAAIRARALRDVGRLDEALIHYADDSDFEKRAHAAGWSTLLVREVYIGHNQTRAAQDASPWYAQDVAHYKRKWAK